MQQRHYHAMYMSTITSASQQDKTSTSSSTESDNSCAHKPKSTLNETKYNTSESMDIIIDTNQIRHRKEHLKLEINKTPDYLSRSQEYLPQQPTKHKRNISDEPLFREDASPSTSPLCDEIYKSVDNGKTIMTKFKSTQTCTTPTTETDSDDVEIKRSKKRIFGRVVSQSIRGSIRLVKKIRPKSDSEVISKDNQLKPEQFRRAKEFATPFLINAHQFSL